LSGSSDGAPITDLLERASGGDDTALADLVPAVYDELKQIAHRQLRRLPESETLNTTALVHEAFLKLTAGTQPGWHDRCHFFAVAARAMRQLAVDYARKRMAEKRGGGRQQVPLEAVPVAAAGEPDVVLAIDDALEKLTDLDPRLARVVECRFFGGLTEPETATALSVTERTVRRDWVKARAWLYRELQ
jgi:RNA polymerase sigma factor (TIGR02999 family)